MAACLYPGMCNLRLHVLIISTLVLGSYAHTGTHTHVHTCTIKKSVQAGLCHVASSCSSLCTFYLRSISVNDYYTSSNILVNS